MPKKADCARRINGAGLVGAINTRWAADVLGMDVNLHNGPDLIDEEKGMGFELKFRLRFENGEKKYCNSWTVFGHQLDYILDLERAYWGLVHYDILGSYSRTFSGSNIEENILGRDMWIINWDWMNRFPKYHNSGSTRISSWDHELVHPKWSELPRVIESYEFEKGNVYFTDGVDLRDFDFF